MKFCRMRLYLFAAVLSVGMVHAVYAQSLDIGGIELRLGQKVDEALRSLSVYQVNYEDNGGWTVSEKLDNNMYRILGVISATDNVVSRIDKVIEIGKSGDAITSEKYTTASIEVRRLGGGTTCTTREAIRNGLIVGFETLCGPYKLWYQMPKDDDTQFFGALIIMLYKQ